jgi:hypothetical protein
MKITRILLLAMLACESAAAVQIVSGSMDRISGLSAYPFSIQLADGFSRAGISDLGAPLAGQQCLYGDPSFPPCQFSPFVDFGIDSTGFGGTLQLSIIGDPVTSIDPATIPVGSTLAVDFAFTVSGFLGAFSDQLGAPCPLPTPDVLGVCTETVTGSGTGQYFLVNQSGPIPPLGRIYLQEEVITFAPEPASLALLIAAGAVALLRALCSGLRWQNPNWRKGTVVA